MSSRFLRATNNCLYSDDYLIFKNLIQVVYNKPFKIYFLFLPLITFAEIKINQNVHTAYEMIALEMLNFQNFIPYNSNIILFNPLIPFDYLKAKKFSGPKRRRNNIVTDLQFKLFIEFAISFPNILIKILYDKPFERYFFLGFSLKFLKKFIV